MRNNLTNNSAEMQMKSKWIESGFNVFKRGKWDFVLPGLHHSVRDTSAARMYFFK